MKTLELHRRSRFSHPGGAKCRARKSRARERLPPDFLHPIIHAGKIRHRIGSKP